ncbi:MAG: hypothetical protein LH613_02950 [Chamaesiphon sp.]|nr:hypothetical protein [Chamaesiphon sp.]
MYKKLSLSLLLLSSSWTSPLERAAQSQPLATIPNLTTVMQTERVEIHNDWNGYSDITPILRHYKLRIKQQKLVGHAHVAVGGYGAAGVHQQQTTSVKIPAAVTTKFLAALAKTPLQVGIYQPKIERTEDYPSIKIKLESDRQQVIFSSQSQASNYVPWKVTVTQANKTTAYISDSDLPAQALQILNPYIDRAGIDRIIQRRRQRNK